MKSDFVSITSYGTGKGSHSSSRSAPLEFVEDQSTPLDPEKLASNMEIFVDMVGEQKKAGEASASFRIVGSPALPQGVTSYFPLLRFKNERQWGYLHFRTKRIRRAIVVEVQYSEKCFTLVEIERREMECFKTYIFFRKDGERIEDREMEMVVRRLARGEG